MPRERNGCRGVAYAVAILALDPDVLRIRLRRDALLVRVELAQRDNQRRPQEDILLVGGIGAVDDVDQGGVAHWSVPSQLSSGRDRTQSASRAHPIIYRCEAGLQASDRRSLAAMRA
jgi:hypothetical protein